MNIQQWAVFFVALISFDYATANYFGHYTGVPEGYDDDNSGYYGWNRGCQCNEELTSNLDEALVSIQRSCSKSYRLLGQSVEEYELTNGKVDGINKLKKKGQYRCSVTHDYVRVFFNIGFTELLIYYKLNFLEEFLNDFMCGIGSLIGKIFGKVANFLFKCVVKDVYVTVVIKQHFYGNQGFVLEGLYLNKIDRIQFLNDEFSQHSNSLEPYFKPLVDHSIRHVCREQLHGHFSKHLRKITAKKEMFSYKRESEIYDDSYYDEDE